MLIVKMALRSLLRHRRRSFFTALMMAGGFTLFSFSLGLSDGTYNGIIEMFTSGHTCDVQIHRRGYLEQPSLYRTIDDRGRIGELLSGRDDVAAYAPRIYAPVLAFKGTKTNGAFVMGVDPAMEASATTLPGQVEKGAFLPERAAREVLLGSGLAGALGAGPGDEIALIGQSADGSIANDNFRVKGVLAAGDSSFGRMHCVMHIDDASEFLFLGSRIHEVAVVLRDHRKAEQGAASIAEELDDPALDVSPWQVIEKEFYSAMLLDRKGSVITNLVIMLIVGIGVLNTVLMSILERTREFGVMKAVGTRPGALFALIMLETAFLSAAAIAAGAAASAALNHYFSFGGISLPEPITYGGMTFSRMVTELNPGVFITPALTVFFTAVCVAAVPALRAARIVPIEAVSQR